MHDRRKFLTTLGIVSTGSALASGSSRFCLDLEVQEDPWAYIRSQFPAAFGEVIHLNSGSAGVMPDPVREKYFELIAELNARPPYEVWNDWQDERMANKQRMSVLLGCSSDEIAIVRNTTEGLNNVLFGMPLEHGDEVIYASCDYPYPVNALKQREKREGIVPVKVQVDIMTHSDEEIVALYEAAITQRTKLILLTHITHREGFIMPAKEICAMAHNYGVEVLVDGAHSFAHIQHNLREIGCDYYATSLHKWLNAPQGNGLLFIKEDKIPGIYPLASADENAAESMGKFDYLGTRGFYNELGIGAALDFLDLTGIPQKQKHLHDLKAYWVERVREIRGVTIHSQTDYNHSCALASVALKKDGKLVRPEIFEKEYNLHFKLTGYPGNGFYRISPNIFTSFEDLDVLVSAFEELSVKG